jgi:hypothetical protein
MTALEVRLSPLMLSVGAVIQVNFEERVLAIKQVS